MEADQIKALIESHIENSEALVEVEGNSVRITVISEAFEGLRAVKKQQLVYGCLNEHIADGTIHAVTMQTHTPAEWEKARKFQL